MSVVFSKPQNRLASRVGRIGLSRIQAVDQARAHVETLRQPTIAYIDENFKLMGELFSEADGAAPPPYGGLYDASNAIASTASLFGLDSLGRGAFSFCELLARLEDERTWNAPAVKVYLDGLSRLRQSKPSTESDEANVILENLARLLSHISTLRDH